jgi:mono/diheme cytochrome c family protein
MTAAFATITLLLCTASGVAADAERGRQFARRVCSACHVIAAGASAGDSRAPSFKSIARSPQFRAKRAKLLWEKHGMMPNLALTADEADDVAAYIRSLAR